MRRVAAALDTGPASLYVYVSGREGLLQAMLDRVIATIEFEAPDPSRWRAQLHSLLQRLHQALVAHPGIAAMTLADSPTTEPVLRLTENLLGILLAGGLDPQDAAWACDIFVLLVIGAAREDDVRRPPGRAMTATASRSTSSTRPSPACRPTGSLFSPPMLRTWSLAMAMSGLVSPSTLLSTACSPERPDGKRSAASAPSSTSGFCCVPPHARRPRSPGTGAAFAPNDRPQQRSHSTSFSRQPGRRARRRHHQPHRRRSPDLPPGG